MAEDNPGEGRKQARSRKAQKRSGDVLDDQDADDDDEARRSDIPSADKTATVRGAGQSDVEPTDAGTEEAAVDESGAEPEPENEDTERDQLTTEPINPASAGAEWLEGLFDRMNLDLEAEGSFQKPNYVFNVSGTDADDLIGRSRSSPKLLQAMQTLLREHLGDDVEGDVLVDVGGFKEKRQGQLAGVADRLGETVQRTGRSMTIAGLDKYERRVIHQRLKDVDGVDTNSVGDGVFRKLRVLAD